jgi:hypothetical protein
MGHLAVTQASLVKSKAIVSQVHVSLANASTIAEKAVGANARAAAVKVGVVHGFLVYMGLVVDNDNNLHGVVVDAGNGKVLSSIQMPIAALTGGGMMMGPNMMQPGNMMQHSGPGMYNPGLMGRPYP